MFAHFRRCCSVKTLYEFSANQARSPGCLKNFSVGSSGYWDNNFFAKNPDMLSGKENMTSGFGRQDNFENWRNSKLGGKENVTSTYASGFGQQDNFENRRNSEPMEFVKGVLDEDRRSFWGNFQQSNVNKEVNPDIAHVRLMRNNTFVTVTDSKGNRKCGASSGCLPELKGGPKLSRYAAEATAEHVGRLARNLGLKSVVMRVNGFTHFKKKRQSIMSFKEGFTSSRTDQSPIVYVEDTTRRAHNGCRLPKKRRV